MSINPSLELVRVYKFVVFLLLLPIFQINTVYAEYGDSIKSGHYYVLSGYAQYGKVLATNPYLKTANVADDAHIEYSAFSFQFLKQTTGAKEWEKNYGYPCYGVGIYCAIFFDNKNFGTPIAIYGTFQAPFKRWNRLSFNYDTGFGFAFNWESFNPSANNYNVSLGAKETVFIDLGLNLKYRLNPNLDLGMGYSFTHFSNGALKSPNMGLNTFSPKITLSYNLNKFAPPSVKESAAPCEKNTSVDISAFGGLKNVIYTGTNVDTIANYKGVNYPVYGINAVIGRQVNSKSRIGIGCSLSYDGSFNSKAYIDHGELESAEGFYSSKLSFSIFPSYEMVIHHLSIVIQPGFYIFRQQSVDKKPITYQRLGLHYQMGKNLFAGICLRAYDYHVSDFIEWTLGYRINVSHRPKY